MTKMTKKEMFATIIEALTTGTSEVTVAEMTAFCQKEIDALDRKAEKTRERAAKRKTESDALYDAVLGVLTEDFQTIAAITAAIDMEDITPSKVTYRLGALVKDGKAQRQEMTIPATETSKSRKVKSYALA